MVESHKGNKIMVSIMLICGNNLLDGFIRHTAGDSNPFFSAASRRMAGSHRLILNDSAIFGWFVWWRNFWEFTIIQAKQQIWGKSFKIMLGNHWWSINPHCIIFRLFLPPSNRDESIYKLLNRALGNGIYFVEIDWTLASGWLLIWRRACDGVSMLYNNFTSF